ncbi:carboxypeptidase-like regulatory domain-containing protein [Flavobacterium sp. TMP13]|uniref:carboxypeptidase-like regulatory domain-containing protein n=1 Tax=Flavobacterium sp. TMP13 TaxID=3425950 RepID=UPI003D776835
MKILKTRKNIEKQFICFFLFLSSGIYSQNMVTGKIVSQTNKTVSNASVQIKLSKDEQTIAFGQSNNIGVFNLNINKKGNYHLRITALGFKTSIKEINITSSLLDLKNIILEESSIELKEILIEKESSGMTEVGDTLHYRIEKFMNGTEENLKDILNKLPGLNVDNQGKIKVHGKTVDRLLIDGQEFFTDQHKIATDNINAEMVKNIAIIKNYTDFKKIKKNEESGLTAINVSIKEQYKNRVTGNLLAGVGENKFNLHATLFNFGKKIFISLISDSNTTGELSITVNDYQTFVNKKNDLNAGEVTFSRNEDLPRFLTLGNNVKNRDSYFTGLNLKYFSSQKVQVNAFSLFNTSTQIEEQLIKEEFYTSTSSFLNRETRKDSEKSFFNTTAIDATYKSNEKSIVNYSSSVSSFKKNNLLFLSNTNSSNESENHAVDFNFSHSLEYTTSLKNNKNIKIRAAQDISNKLNDLQITANQPFLNLNFPSGTYQINQNTQSIKKTISLNASYDFNIHKLPLTLLTELTQKKDQFDSFETNFSSFNNSEYIQNRIHTIGLVSQFNLTSKTKFTTSLAHTSLKLQTRYNETNKSLFTPSFTMKTNFSKQHYIKFNYALNTKLVASENTIQNQISTDYRTQYGNDDVRYNTINKSSQATAEYYYNNFKRKFNILSRVSSLRSKNPITTNSFASQNSNLILYKITPYENYFDSFVFSEKQFTNFPFSVKGSISYSANVKHIFYENLKNSLHSETATGFIALVSRLKNKNIQFETGIQYSKEIYTDNFSKNLLTVLSPNFNTSIQLTQQLSFSSSFSVENFKSTTAQNTIYNFSPKIRYKIPKSKIELSAFGSNIFNIKNNEEIKILRFANYNQEKTSQTLAGYYMVSAKIKL